MLSAHEDLATFAKLVRFLLRHHQYKRILPAPQVAPSPADARQFQPHSHGTVEHVTSLEGQRWEESRCSGVRKADGPIRQVEIPDSGRDANRASLITTTREV